jgi:hypothetical protein
MGKNNAIPAGLNFEDATEEKLEQGIKSAGKELENKYIVKYPDMYVRTVSGGTYRMPLAVHADYFDDIDGSLSPLEQIILMLERENPGKTKEIRTELSASLLAIADKYTDVIQDVQMATVGKYKNSGNESDQTERK